MKGRGRWLVWLAAFWLWTVGFGTAWAQPQAPQLACALTDGSGTALWMLQDANRTTKLTWPGGALTLESEEPIAALYLIWDKPPGAWTGQAGEQPLRGGEEGFIHEYIPLESPVRQLTLTLPEGALCCDVYAFGQGALPRGWRPSTAAKFTLSFPTQSTG